MTFHSDRLRDHAGSLRDHHSRAIPQNVNIPATWLRRDREIPYRMIPHPPHRCAPGQGCFPSGVNEPRSAGAFRIVRDRGLSGKVPCSSAMPLGDCRAHRPGTCTKKGLSDPLRLSPGVSKRFQWLAEICTGICAVACAVLGCLPIEIIGNSGNGQAIMNVRRYEITAIAVMPDDGQARRTGAVARQASNLVSHNPATHSRPRLQARNPERKGTPDAH